MRRKKEHHEEHVDETWLIPYADMLTLLLALFIVMFAMSKVDAEKMKAVSGAFNAVFSGGTGVLEPDSKTEIPITPPDGYVPVDPSGGSGLTGAELEESTMQGIKDSLEKELAKRGYGDKVGIELTGGGLDISIQDTVLFKSGDAAITGGVNPLLTQIAQLLQGLGDNDIRIVGHTDNVPIRNSTFKSNWELSSSRAITVMNFMVQSGGLNEKKLSIQAYAEFKPKHSNEDEAGRAKNRRVEIFIARKYAAPSKEVKVQ